MMGPLPPSLTIWVTNSKFALKPGRGFDALREIAHFREAGEFRGGLAFVHDVQDRIEEAIQADKDVDFASRPRAPVSCAKTCAGRVPVMRGL